MRHPARGCSGDIGSSERQAGEPANPLGEIDIFKIDSFARPQDERIGFWRMGHFGKQSARIKEEPGIRSGISQLRLETWHKLFGLRVDRLPNSIHLLRFRLPGGIIDFGRFEVVSRAD